MKDTNAVNLIRNPQRLLRVSDTVFSGRTLSEYEKMFNLNFNLVKGSSFLDCPAGYSSFASEAKKLGINVTACDAIYHKSLEQLRSLAKYEIKATRQRTKMLCHIYNWDLYKSIPNLMRYRRSALEKFLADYAKSAGKTYIHAALPSLPFKDNNFGTVLSANLIFSYDDELGYKFHIRAIRELLRVAKDEVRIYPVEKPYGKPKFLGKILKELKRDGVETKIVRTEYEYLKGVNKMLLLSKN